MPSKKKKYNARFPPARIKKIMQMDEDVGKVAATVPVIISRALELFIESLIQQATKMTVAKNAKTLSSSHLKHIIESHDRYHFLRDLVANVSDHQVEEDTGVPATNHSYEEESGSSTASGKRPRGRPRKSKETSNSVPQKRERRKRKKESSSSESENSEDTEDAEEGTDEEVEPAAPPVPPTFHRANCEPSSSATDLSLPPSDTTTLTHPPPLSQLLTHSQEDSIAQPQEVSAPVESGQADPHQEAPLSVPSESVVSTFQAAPAMMPAAMPMYQNVAAPHLFTWPAPTNMLAGGFPTLPAQSHAAFAGLQPQAGGFPGMMLPSLGFPAMAPPLMAFPGVPGVGFPAVSPLAPGFPALNMAGGGLAAMPGKVPTTVSTPNGAQGDDDYDT